MVILFTTALFALAFIVTYLAVRWLTQLPPLLLACVCFCGLTIYPLALSTGCGITKALFGALLAGVALTLLLDLISSFRSR